MLKIKEIRKNKKLTQKQVADELGVKVSTFSGYETGHSKPDIEKLQKLSEIFEVSIDELFNGEFENEVRTSFELPIKKEGTPYFDVDFHKNVIRIETKTKVLKTKIIPRIIIDDLKTFVSDRSGFIFEPQNTDWNSTKETNRRDYYTKKFSDFRKKNNIDKDFKLYHFRHTFITWIYLELRKTLSKENSIKELSLITGHDSKAIHSYIQVNDIELPKDYSGLLKRDY